MALCSIAIAAGVVGLFAVAKRWIFRRRFAPWAFSACGPGFGDHGGCGRWANRERHGFEDWSRGAGRAGRSFWLRGVFSRLDTTPGQEREIRSAIEELQKSAREARNG